MLKRLFKAEGAQERTCIGRPWSNSIDEGHNHNPGGAFATRASSNLWSSDFFIMRIAAYKIPHQIEGGESYGFWEHHIFRCFLSISDF
jgi:hypothetical protein